MRRLLCTVLLLGGCNVDPYCLNCTVNRIPDASVIVPDADSDAGLAVDAFVADACVATGVETCDGFDNDCNGLIDDGDFPGEGEPCGTDVGECVAGTTACVMGDIVCGNGAVNPVAEVCNSRDDDCDGTADNGDPGGGELCGTNVGECVQGLSSCIGGSVVCVGEVPPATEVCDGRDNDCDDEYDEDDPTMDDPCGAPPACIPGGMQCIGGSMICVGAVPANVELCDGLDNDCDTFIDEDFDLDTDIRHCGTCPTICEVDNGIPECVAGDCAIRYCLSGYFDENGDYTDGCEYACTYNGNEVCNGDDDDCDGDVDEDLLPPSICGNLGECLGSVAECTGSGGWVCSYGPTVSTDSAGDIIPETTCDDLDNDCDGVADDSFPTKGNDCYQGLGVCRTSGHWVCNATDDGVECNAPTPPSPGVESGSCNGLDDDCDGTVDDGITDDWMQITAPSCDLSGWQVIQTSNAYTYTIPASTVVTAGNHLIIARNNTRANFQTAWGVTLSATTIFLNAGGTSLPNIDGGETFTLKSTVPNTVTVDGPTVSGTSGQSYRRTGSGLASLTANWTNAVYTGNATPGTSTVTNAPRPIITEFSDAANANNEFVEILCPSWTHYIYRYEATRPDATASADGVLTDRACSVSGRLPWTGVSHPQAETACTAAGGRLCSEWEWQRACQTTAATPCQWSNDATCTTYKSGLTNGCNDNEYDSDSGTTGDQDAISATGAFANCHANWDYSGKNGIFDLSGNVKEWTQERAAALNPLRGGSYNNRGTPSTNNLSGTSCTWNFVVADDVYRFDNVGFRCCADTLP